MAQTSYPIYMPKAYAGMKADSRFSTTETFQAKEELPLGYGVIKETGKDHVCRLPAEADEATAFLGVVLADHAREQDRDGTVVVAAKEAASVLTEGAVYVPVDENVTSDDPVYLRIQTEADRGAPGVFGKTASAGNNILIAGARYKESAAAGEVAKLVLNLPNG